MKIKESIRRPKLIVEIAIVITCKLLVIFALWYFFFSPSHRPAVTAETMDGVLLGTAKPAAEAVQHR